MKKAVWTLIVLLTMGFAVPAFAGHENNGSNGGGTGYGNGHGQNKGQGATQNNDNGRY